MNYNFKDLKSQLIKGKVDATINALSDIAKNDLKDKSFEKELTILHYRWEKIQREERQNVISYEKASITKNQITSAVLEVLDKIQKKTLEGNQSPDKKNSSLIKYIAGVVILLTATIVVYFNFLKPNSSGQDSSFYIQCPFTDTIPYNILIFPFEGIGVDEQTRDIERSLQRGLTDRAAMNNLITIARIHEEKIEIPDYNFAKNKLDECKSNLNIWGSYEEKDSTYLTIRYVADNFTSEIIDQENKIITSTVKNISSLESGEIISKLDDIISLTVPLLTGLNMVKENKLDDAIKEFQKINTANKKVNNLVSRNIGDVHLLKNDYDAAIESYEEVASDNEKDATSFNNIAFALYKKGDLQGAWDNFEKAAKLDPDNSDIIENLRKVKEEFDLKYANIEEPKPIVNTDKPIEQPIVIPENDLPTICLSYTECFNEGNRLAIKGDYSDALVYFESAIEYDNTKATPYLGIGNVHNSQDNYDQAILAYTKAIEVEPEFPNSYYELGNVYKKKGDVDNAKKYYEIFNAKGGKLVTKRVN